MTVFEPAYLKTRSAGCLQEKISAAQAVLKKCTLCPRKCKIDRISGQVGICKTGLQALVSSYNPHFGEESPLVGSNGSGTIFFTHCSLLCIFCQNFDISHEGFGRPVSSEKLAHMMLDLQDKGCHNINFVTPSHVVPQILSALDIAAEKGLSIPLIYNTSGYDSLDTLKTLDGVIDIYMPDFKFWDPEVAEKTCNAPDYPEVVRSAVAEMHRQVGDLVTDTAGTAQRGLLVRHLVLPENLAGTREVMRFIATEISKNTYVNIMPQYRPCGRADEVKELSKALSTDDFKRALSAAEEEGITRLDQQRRVFVLW